MYCFWHDMHFVIVSSGYPQFLQWLYRDAHANLAEQTFAEQRQAYYASLFATSDFYAHGLQMLGHHVEEFIYNCDPMQLAWRRENLRRSATGGVEFFGSQGVYHQCGEMMLTSTCSNG